MKAFRFRLESARRWRAAQLRMEQENVSRIAAHIKALEEELVSTHNALRSGSRELASVGSTAFGSWSAYAERCHRRIHQIEKGLSDARQALAAQTQVMVEAHRKLRVLENLERDERRGWQKELDCETEVFATEAFLARLVGHQVARDNGPTGA